MHALLLLMLLLLQIQNNMEKKRSSASSSQVAEIAGKQAVLDALHAKAMTMFAQLDTDGNGVIDRWGPGGGGARRLQHIQLQNCPGKDVDRWINITCCLADLSC
jgi:hypothetical protein